MAKAACSMLLALLPIAALSCSDISGTWKLGNGENLVLITDGNVGGGGCRFAGLSDGQVAYGSVDGAAVTGTMTLYADAQGTFQGSDTIQMGDGSTWTRESTSTQTLAATRNATSKYPLGCSDISGTWKLGNGENLELITDGCRFAGLSAGQVASGSVDGAAVTGTMTLYADAQGTFQGSDTIQMGDGTKWTRESLAVRVVV